MGTIKNAFYAQSGGRDGSNQRYLTRLWSGKRPARGEAELTNVQWTFVQPNGRTGCASWTMSGAGVRSEMGRAGHICQGRKAGDIKYEKA